MKHTHFLGIDAGKHTGYCLYSKQEKRIVEIGTTDFFTLINDLLPRFIYQHIGESEAKEKLCVYVEDPAQNKPVFLSRYEPDTVKKALKIAQDVGGNKREATLLIDYFTKHNYKVVRYKPTSEKWDKERFWQITNHKERTSQHARDACKMVFGR
jgi:hypothetical protein